MSGNAVFNHMFSNNVYIGLGGMGGVEVGKDGVVSTTTFPTILDSFW